MSKAPPQPKSVLRVRGARQNNLKGFDLDIECGSLTVVTGRSGSGKSSLAFDTLFAEGQRRYIETFSPYARQFFDRMDKPAVDSIEGIPPAIAIEQRNSVRTSRSTVGTMTEICDHMKVLWPHLAKLHCRQCGKPVEKEPPQRVWEVISDQSSVISEGGVAECLVTFDLALSEKLPLKESLALLAKQGYQRLLLDGEIVRIEDAPPLITDHRSRITVIQDRVRLAPENRARFIEACEQAYHFGKGHLTIHPIPHLQSPIPSATPLPFSNRFHCAACDIEYREPSPSLFSFNNPVGACPACKGFGRVIGIDFERAIPDRSKSLRDGAVKPWQTGVGAGSQKDLLKSCKKRGVPVDVPFRELSTAQRDWVMNGDPGYGSDKAHEWPHAWYGVKGYFRWLESKAYKMHVRVLLSRYRAYSRCPECEGRRLNADALLYRLAIDDSRLTRAAPDSEPARQSQIANRKSQLSLADFYALPVKSALEAIDSLAAGHSAFRDPRSAFSLALDEVRTRLGYLCEVGLGYLTLDRTTRTLSGGETERVNLTTCLGTRLVNTLFVLDEPSVGLHARDTDRLIRILHRLRDTGNTVVVVEHEPSVMRAADRIIDLGPDHGATGGELMFHGPAETLIKTGGTLTGDYLSGKRAIPQPQRRPVVTGANALRLEHATLHNLRDLSVTIPLGRFVCLTGVSGSGKTTLARDLLVPLLDAQLSAQANAETAPLENPEADDEDTAAHDALRNATLDGARHLGHVLLVDQSGLGRTPRSNPAVYVGAFDSIRELFAASPAAKARGFNASAFSFNSALGQCDRCRGAGFEKIEMQFLSDIFVRCPACHGRRYREHVLEVKLAAPSGGRAYSIGEFLDATIEDALAFLGEFKESRHASRAAARLQFLAEVGLGYLQLGQPINTLSGGESQRLKLAAHVAEHAVSAERNVKPTLFVFDEPTTGLHFEDVRVLLAAMQRLVDAGHSLLVLEHNLDVIKCADWVIDLGPDAGEDGGRLVAEGTPEQIAASEQSITGAFLRTSLRR